MNFHLKSLSKLPLERIKADLLVVCVPESGLPSEHALTPLLEKARLAKAFEGQAGQIFFLWQPNGVAAQQVVLLGLGKGAPSQWRQAMQKLAAWIKDKNLGQVDLCMEPQAPVQWRLALRTLSEGCYTYTHTKPSAKALVVKVNVWVNDATKVKSTFNEVLAVLHGIALAREWGNRPGNHATPRHLSEAAKELGQRKNMTCQVLAPAQLVKLKMGAFLAVAQASAEPAAFIVLQYKGAPVHQAPTVLVGKGITFDTGGISLKPGAGMDEMKFDMCGAASVLGAFAALAELQPKINVVGLIPACENMPGGKAVKPGDVVTSASGQTIEILNTDAEGRLILSDALWYARRFKPKAVIDIATLTGACVIALGHVRSGLYANDETLATQLLQAGEEWDDLCWRMPLDDAYAEGLKSNFADMANVADRAAGSVTAAKFLQRFAPDTGWAHLDIAGTAWKSGAAKGATGRPVALLLGYLLSQARAVSARA